MTETPSLLPYQSTLLERAIECGLHRRFNALPVPLRTLYDPDLCPADLLGWLAWSQSVDVWDDDWSEAEKRAVIRASFFVHARKGTVAAVRRALDALRIGLEIREWFETDDAPGTFRVDAFADHIFAAGYGINPALLAMIAAHIDTIKPARAHYSLRVGERFKTAVMVRAGSRVRAKQSGRIAARPAADVETSSVCLRAAARARAVHRATHNFEASNI